MNNLLKILVLAICCSYAHGTMAQNALRPWSVGVGFNAVDYYPNGEGVTDSSDPKPFSNQIFSEFFNSTDHYNSSPMTLQFFFGRYLGKGFTFEVSGAFNSISEYGDLRVEDLAYFALDGKINYSFRSLIDPTGWAEPFIGVGGGYTWVEEDRTRDMLGTGNLDGTIGFAVWVSEKVSILYRVAFKYMDYEHELKDFTDSHFQHFIGVKYVFSFRCSTCYNFK